MCLFLFGIHLSISVYILMVLANANFDVMIRLLIHTVHESFIGDRVARHVRECLHQKIIEMDAYSEYYG